MAQWNKQMKALRRSAIRTRVGRVLFCKNTEKAVKKNNSPRFTAFTAKRCKKYAVKIDRQTSTLVKQIIYGRAHSFIHVLTWEQKSALLGKFFTHKTDHIWKLSHLSKIVKRNFVWTFMEHIWSISGSKYLSSMRAPLPPPP